MKLFFLSLHILSGLYVQAQPKDTLYQVRFVSAEDTMPLCFVPVKAFHSGIIVASWEADTDGYITIKRKEVRQYPKALITLHYPGFENITFKADTLFMRDTLVIAANPKPTVFDEIQIISYKVPMIEKQTPWYRRHKKQKKEPEKFPVYSPAQCMAYEALQKGVWLQKDTLARNRILAYDSLHRNYKPEKNTYSPGGLLQRYLMYSISYPEQAMDFLMEEKVWISFELDQKGNVNYLKVLKGNSVDLVLEVANALARMPGINLRSVFPEYHEPFPPKLLKPARFVLPVKFKLQ